MTLPTTKTYDVEEVPFQGLQLHAVEVEIAPMGASVWCFMKRADGSIVRCWISHPSNDGVPLRVWVETEEL